MQDFSLRALEEALSLLTIPQVLHSPRVSLLAESVRPFLLMQDEKVLFFKISSKG